MSAQGSPTSAESIGSAATLGLSSLSACLIPATKSGSASALALAAVALVIVLDIVEQRGGFACLLDALPGVHLQLPAQLRAGDQLVREIGVEQEIDRARRPQPSGFAGIARYEQQLVVGERRRAPDEMIR